MKIQFEHLSGKVVGVNREIQPFEYEKEFLGTPLASKVIERIVGERHKTNDEGELLYYNEGREETLPQNSDAEGFEPVMIPVVEETMITFKDSPFEFTYDELKDAPMEYSKEQVSEMEREQLLLVIADLYEANLAAKAENEQAMLAVAEVYELVLGGAVK